jgi:hypothetical protein
MALRQSVFGGGDFMGLEQFKKPDNICFEVDDQKFVFSLPTRWNKAYTRDWQSYLAANSKIDGEGKITIVGTSPSDLKDAQISAFLSHCYIDGPLTREQLGDEYYPLLDAVFEAASTMATDKEAETDNLVKKFSTSLNGKSDGKEKLISTISSSSKAA